MIFSSQAIIVEYEDATPSTLLPNHHKIVEFDQDAEEFL